MGKQTDYFYNTFSFLYPLADVFLKAHKRALLKQVNKQPFGQLLEIGVGNGRHLHMYTTHKITGIDTSLNMLRIAKSKQANVELLQMSGEALAFAGHSFDYIVLSHVLAVAGDPETMLQEAYRVLKPNGKLFILNHFTPANRLRYVDYAFQPVARMFHFKSMFFINRLNTIKKFNLLQETSFGRYGYFKLLIYSKP